MSVKTFRVYAKRVVYLYTTVEAESVDEAEHYANTNFSDLDWSECDESMDTQIDFGEGEEDV